MRLATTKWTDQLGFTRFLGDYFELKANICWAFDGNCESETEFKFGPKQRILFVDDNRDNAASLAMLLTMMGNDTRTAHDGLQAVELAEAFRPDLIMLDIGLPKLNGYDACRRIRQYAWSKDVVIVAATGWGQAEDRRRSQEAGFNHHLVKPIDATKLNRLLGQQKVVIVFTDQLLL